MNKNTERLTPFSCLISLNYAYFIHLRIYLHDSICPNYSYLLKSNKFFCFRFIILVSYFLLSIYHLVNQNGVYPTAIALNNNNYSSTATTATATTNNHHHHYPAAQLQTQATYASIPTASIITPSNNTNYNNNNSYNSPYNNTTNITTATTMNPTYSQQKPYQPSTAGVNTAYPAYNASPNVVASGTFVYPVFGTNNATSSTLATAATITTTNTASSSSSSSQNLSALNSLNYLGVNANVKSDETKKAELMDQVTMRLYEVMDQKNRKLRDEMDFEFSTTSYLDSSTKNIADKKICKLLMMILMIWMMMTTF